MGKGRTSAHLWPRSLLGLRARYGLCRALIPDTVINMENRTRICKLALRYRSIPIVAISCGYPVEAGVGYSLARPGKNVTGNSLYAGTEIWGKLLRLLNEVKPGTKRINVLWTYVPPLFPREEIDPAYAELRNAAHSLGSTLQIVEAATSDQVAVAMKQIDAARPDALLITARRTGIPFEIDCHGVRCEEATCAFAGATTQSIAAAANSDQVVVLNLRFTILYPFILSLN